MKDRKYTKEAFIDKLTSYIKSVGHRMTYKEIIEGCGVKTTILQKFGISLLALQKEIFGLQCDRVHHMSSDGSLSSQAEDSDYVEIRDAIKSKQNDEIVLAAIRKCISKNGRYTGIVELMKKTGLSFEPLHRYDIQGINTSLGYENERRSCAEDDLYLLLVERFGKDAVSREHTFMDCRSVKGWPLRFDFYIPTYSALIELDGVSHDTNNPIHGLCVDENRKIKEAYAKEHGMRLFVYTYKDITEIPALLERIVLDILKPVELLEPPSGQSATKPTEMSEGSETIERHSDVNQVE